MLRKKVPVLNKTFWVALALILALCTGGYLFHRAISRPAAPQAGVTRPQPQSEIHPVLTELPSLPGESDSFDDPLHKTVVDLGQSPYLMPGNPNHSTLTCKYYSAFMVKELDMKEQGDEWTAVAPSNPQNMPACVQQHGRDEFEIKDADGHNWAGYFAGVKWNLVFLDGDDGYNEGMPFGVFDALTGRKVFEDSSEFLNGQRLHITNKDGQLIIRYRRVDAAECSIPQKNEECWRHIRMKAGLEPQPMPKCSGYDQKGVDNTDPSVVSYLYEVALLPSLKQRALPGEVKCRPAD